MTKKKAPAPPPGPGRPKKDGYRLHIYMPVEGYASMERCSKGVDATGPSETIRMALRHYANLLAEESRQGTIVARRPDGSKYVLVIDPLRLGADLENKRGMKKRRMHINISPESHEDFVACADHVEKVTGLAREDLPNGEVVALAMLHFEEVLVEFQAGSVVLVRRPSAGQLGYSIWTDLNAAPTSKRLAA